MQTIYDLSRNEILRLSMRKSLKQLCVDHNVGTTNFKIHCREKLKIFQWPYRKFQAYFGLLNFYGNDIDLPNKEFMINHPEFIYNLRFKNESNEESPTLARLLKLKYKKKHKSKIKSLNEVPNEVHISNDEIIIENINENKIKEEAYGGLLLIDNQDNDNKNKEDVGLLIDNLFINQNLYEEEHGGLY